MLRKEILQQIHATRCKVHNDLFTIANPIFSLPPAQIFMLFRDNFERVPNNRNADISSPPTRAIKSNGNEQEPAVVE